MPRTRAAVALILVLSCAATLGATLVASPSRAAAPPRSSAPATTDSTGGPVTAGPGTTPTTGPPVGVKLLVQVPNLVGLSQEEVVERLAAAGLTLGTVTGTAGTPVTVQNPPVGSFVDPYKVRIDVTLGVLTTTPAFVVVPDLRGFSVAHARRVVHALGLRFSTSARTGHVASQFPPAHKVVGLGVTVSVAVGSRVAVRYVEVPDVRSDSLDAARAAVTGLGLTLSAPNGPGTVATQNPPPGQPAAVGSSVSVTLAVVAAPTSARPRSPLLYWVIAALALVAIAVTGGSVAHRRQRGRRRDDDAHPPEPPAAWVTSRLIADTVHTTRGGPAGPSVELRTRERASLKVERVP